MSPPPEPTLAETQFRYGEQDRARVPKLQRLVRALIAAEVVTTDDAVQALLGLVLPATAGHVISIGLDGTSFALGAPTVAWGDITGPIADQEDLGNALDAKLNSADYTAADVLAKLLTVDSDTSGLNAQYLGGHDAASFINALSLKLDDSQAGAFGLTLLGATTLAAAKIALGYTASDIGLGSVENKSSATIRGEITGLNVTTALGYIPANASSLADYMPKTGGDFTGPIAVGSGHLTSLRGGLVVTSAAGNVQFSLTTTGGTANVSSVNPGATAYAPLQFNAMTSMAFSVSPAGFAAVIRFFISPAGTATTGDHSVSGRVTAATMAITGLTNHVDDAAAAAAGLAVGRLYRNGSVVMVRVV